MFVSASENLVEHSFHFPDSMTNTLAAVDGVSEVQRMRMSRIQLGGESALLVATDLEKVAGRSGNRGTVAGDSNSMYRRTAEGKGVIVSETFSLLHHLGMNDVVDISYPSGILRLPIVGVLRDYTYQSGSLFVDYSIYQRYWNDPSVDIYRIYLAPSFSAAVVKRHMLDLFGTPAAYLSSTTQKSGSGS